MGFSPTGLIFSYFQIAIISIVLLPYTYGQLTLGSKKSVEQDGPCPCAACVEKRSRRKTVKVRSWKRPLLLAVAWAYLAYVVSIAASRTLEEILWSPYEILGVDESATPAQVKSAFRKMAVKWHPDKVSKDLQEEAGRKYAEMTKAYKTLTNEDAKALFVCLPSFLISG